MAEGSSCQSPTHEAGEAIIPPKISSERILVSIKKMLDEIKLLPLDSSELNDIGIAHNIIENTDQNGYLAIINRFYNYYTSNKRGFLERSEELIQPDLPLTKKICISIGSVIKNTGGKTSEMWSHLTLIFYLISLYKNQPDQKLKQLLKEKVDEDDEDDSVVAGSMVTTDGKDCKDCKDCKDGKDGNREVLRKKLRRKRRGEEEDVIADVVKTVSSGISGPIDDPMQALTSLMTSGGLQRIMGTLQTAMSSGRVKPKRMLNQVHQMLSNLTEQIPDDDKNDDEDDEKK